ncbi:MAG: ABC transporter substrate-binding protein [Dehalococcoidia bacterium]|nr:ABC transporter substrate-binding protein [Dehalococcoidia bacterium]
MSKNKVVLTIFGLVVVTLAVVLSACAPAAVPTPTPTKPPPAAAVATPTPVPPKPTPAPPTPTPTPAPAKVRFASPGFVSDAGAFIAMEKGYFKEQAIEMELVTIKTAADAPPLLARGDIEVAGGSSSAGLYNAIARGIDLKIVADKGSSPKGFGFQGLVVRKDLVDQIKAPADLKGKKIALSCSNCIMDYLLELILKPANLSLKDVDTVDMAVPDMLAAFANKSIEVAGMIEPNPTIAADRGLGVFWIKSDVVDPDQQVAQIIMSDAFVKNVDVARRWVLAYVKGLRDYNDAFGKNKNRAEIVAILAKYSAVKEVALYDKMVMAGLHPDGKINTDSLLSQQEFFIRRGGMKERVDLKKAIDTQFIDYALQQLGPYR